MQRWAGLGKPERAEVMHLSAAPVSTLCAPFPKHGSGPHGSTTQHSTPLRAAPQSVCQSEGETRPIHRAGQRGKEAWQVLSQVPWYC